MASAAKTEIRKGCVEKKADRYLALIRTKESQKREYIRDVLNSSSLLKFTASPIICPLDSSGGISSSLPLLNIHFNKITNYYGARTTCALIAVVTIC
jgi:hypothetical protein